VNSAFVCSAPPTNDEICWRFVLSPIPITLLNLCFLFVQLRRVRHAACGRHEIGGRMRPCWGCSNLGDVAMKHPARGDFHVIVTEAGVSVTFKPTNSTYSFCRLADGNDIARLGPVSFAGVQHAGRNTGDYAAQAVQDMAQRLASEFAASVWLQEDNALTGVRSSTNDAIAQPAAPASSRRTGRGGSTKERRVASEVAATLWLIQNLDKTD
jgi:hypothetical protein